MTQQIARFSPHQNAKVLSILMALGALLFLVPFMLIAYMAAPADGKPPMLFFLAMPIIYLVLGYISVVIGCAIYNLLFKHIGGIEFETRAMDA